MCLCDELNLPSTSIYIIHNIFCDILGASDPSNFLAKGNEVTTWINIPAATEAIPTAWWSQAFKRYSLDKNLILKHTYTVLQAEVSFWHP